MMNNIEILGLIAGIFTTLSFIPQIKKTWVSRSVKDISSHMYIIYCSGLFLWIVYGFFIESISLIIANCTTLVLALSILILKFKWHDT